MNALPRHLRLVVDVVTPVAIGTGELPLLPEFDYLPSAGALLVYDRFTGQRDGDGRLVGTPEPAYRLPYGGTGAPGPVRPATKDAFLVPYLPGSAVKGALHTALAAVLLERERAAGRPATKDELAPSVRFAAQPIERRLFGAQPRASGWRALRVTDLRPGEEARLTLAALRSYGTEDGKLVPLSDRLAAEVVAPGGRFVGALTIDEALLELEHPRLEPAPNRSAIGEVIALAREDGLRRAAAERAYFAAAGAAGFVALFDALLSWAEACREGCLIQLGWGAGWGSKSLGAALTASADWPAIRAEFFGGRSERGRPAERPRPGDRGRPTSRHGLAPFPATRKLVERGGAPALPLGWALVTAVAPEAPLPERLALPVGWEDDAFAVVERVPVAAGASPVREPERPAPATPFAALQALLRPQQTPDEQPEAAPPPPIPRVADRALKVGTILEAEVVAVEPTRLLVDLGRSQPAALEAATVGGGNLSARFRVGQRLRVRVITPPPFFRIRLA